jgi:hypothetical protein
MWKIMAFLDVHIKKNGTWRKPLRLGAALGWLCLAAATQAAADGPVPATPSLISKPTLAIPAAFAGLQPHQFGQTTDLMTQLGLNSASPLNIPLNVKFGQSSGVSFVYNLAAASQAQNGKAVAPRAAAYGFSNALALSHDALHLNGLMYFANGQNAGGQNKQSQLISQALAFENKGWTFDAHYQSVGKDFGAGDNVKNAATKLGLAANLNEAMANQLEGLRGQNDLGFGLAHTDAHGSLGFQLKENTNQVTHLQTMTQSLAFGHTLGRGMQFDASRDTVSAKATDGGDPSKALNTTTNHLKFGMDQGKGLSLSAEANLIGDSKGRAEQHMAYQFGDQFKNSQFHTSFQTNSAKTGSGKNTDQTLGVDFNQQTKGLGLKASFLQFSQTTANGQSVGKLTEHLELAAKNVQMVANLQTDSSKAADGKRGADKNNVLDLNWQARNDLTVKAHWNDASRLDSSTQKTNTTRTMGLDVARQGKGLTWEASLVQVAPNADKSQAVTTEHFEMNWQARQDITLQGHWNLVSAQTVHADPNAAGANRDEKRDLTATLNALRLHGLKNSSAVLNLAQTVSQGKMQSDTRALRFETDMPDTHVHLEYCGSDLGWDQGRNSIVSRAVRIASIKPGDWLHYSAYYKQRSQTLGGKLPDVRDYLVKTQLKHVNIAYHYLNQHEEENGSVTDTVESHYTVDGPLTKKLAWNVEYDQTGHRADSSALESWLLGFKSAPTERTLVELMLGRPEMRVDGTTVPGQTFKLTYICKMDEADTFSFNGEVTNWTRKTKATPSTVSGKVRLDLAKGF